MSFFLIVFFITKLGHKRTFPSYRWPSLKNITHEPGPPVEACKYYRRSIEALRAYASATRYENA